VTAPRRVTALIDLPARVGYPNGFSERLAWLLAALAQRSTLSVLVLRGPYPHVAVAGPASGYVEASLSAVSVELLDVGDNPLIDAGARGRFRRLIHYLTPGPPVHCHPRDMRAVARRIATQSPDGVVIYRAHLAHAALALPPELPVVTVLEDAWNPFDPVDTTSTGATGLRATLMARTEPRRESRLYRSVVDRSAWTTLISETEREKIATLVDTHKIGVVPHGVDPDRLGADRDTDDPDRDIDVLVVGVMTQARNAEPVEAIWSAAKTMGVDTSRWAAVGLGAEELVLGPGIQRGPVDDLQPVYARARVVLVPASRGEGVKTTLLQAWAAGVATVASPFAVRGVDAGPGTNIVLAEDPTSFVQRATELLNDPARRREVGAAGRVVAVRDHDLRRIAATFAETCLRAMGPGPGDQ
jgi:glycosyltransferase involved in cell wall biosynthesis